MLAPGTLLENRYEIVRPLGSGAMACVYLVRHVALLSQHALKVLDDTLAADADLRNRFLAEGRIQAQLAHPNVVSVTDIVTQPVAGLVMEYVEGPTLDGFVQAHGGPPDLALVLDLLLPVLDAVGAAHALGIVHRDLKPENIIVSRDSRGRPRPMVADFGIAKIMGAEAARFGKRKTEAGLRMGTLLYMSPEQVRGSADLDARSDIFALGAILYEVVTGRVAFAADSEFDTMKNIVEGQFAPPERLIGGLPPVVAACIRKALAVDPAERFETCDAFRQALALATTPGAPLPQRPSLSIAVTRLPEPVGPVPVARADAASSRPAPPAIPPAAGPALRSREVAPAKPARAPLAGSVGGLVTPPRPPPPPPPRPPSLPALPTHAPGLPPDPGTSPLLAALLGLVCIPGVGQLYNGQAAKGLVLMVVVSTLTCATGGFSWFLTAPVLAIDAWGVAARRKRGSRVGAWTSF
ncbi:MAG: protein kinase [Pseudomonadota bacterium]|nr:protein kinase [Pseudomonadota bacterium]